MSSQAFQESLFGIPVSTYRDRNVALAPFPYEMLIAAVCITFFRTTIYLEKEPKLLRWFFGLTLGFLAYKDKSYELIIAVEIFSYAVPFWLFYFDLPGPRRQISTKDGSTTGSNAATVTGTDPGTDGGRLPGLQFDSRQMLRLLGIAMSALMSLTFCHVAASGHLLHWISLITPDFFMRGLASAVPIDEVSAAYNVVDRFVLEPGLLKSQVARLLFVTFHVQIGIGYLGIDFLKQEQNRRNELVRMDMDEAPESTAATPTSTTTDNGTSNGGGNNSSNHSAAGPSNGEGHDDESTEKDSPKMKKAKRFQRSAAPFIFFFAVPYMIKIIFFGNLNAFAYACFKDDIHRAVRLHGLFEHDNNLVALAQHSAKSPDAFAGYMNTIVETTYDLFNRKLFSLPKVLLLPLVMSRQPKMIAQLFPIIFFTDWLKGKAIAYMTNRIETLQKEIQELEATRSKVEAFDMKNADLLQRAGAGATTFTSRKWEELTVQVQMKSIVKDLTTRTKLFFGWIQRNFVFSVLVDCGLAHLIAVGKIVSADIFVFSRAIEDAVDMALMKSRSEAELARMMTQIGNMEELATVWDDAKQRSLLNCNLAPPPSSSSVEHEGSKLVLRNLLYSRGTAVVRIDHLELKAGVYALTGANGSGKSTLFRVLMSCDTNDRSIDLPPSIVLSTPSEPLIEEDDARREITCEAADVAVAVEDDQQEEGFQNEENNSSSDMEESCHPRSSVTMPSSHVVEISQTFYWPLYTKPIDWMYQEHVTTSKTRSEKEVQDLVREVAFHLHSLEFTQSLTGTEQQQQGGGDENNNTSSLAPSADVIDGIISNLVEEKEDWFSDLSGGQKSKVELVRKVFLQDSCPDILLIDETMAPLDPRSKSLVMSKLKSFCLESVIIVIYHTDVGRETQEPIDGENDGDNENDNKAVECVPSNGFFDGNIHVENQVINIRPVC